VSAVEAMVDAVLAANPKQLADYCGGKTKLAGFFTGQVGGVFFRSNWLA
jgi:aspartyl-tRNA(Asn)/glutamyl-tRNA(Gln) amidotransferase subunit B